MTKKVYRVGKECTKLKIANTSGRPFGHPMSGKGILRVVFFVSK